MLSMTTKSRAKDVERAIRLTWESLESHLRYTHIRTTEGEEFHQKCVKDYAELIKLLSNLF